LVSANTSLDVLLGDAPLGVVLGDMAEVVSLPGHPAWVHPESMSVCTYAASILSPGSCNAVLPPEPDDARAASAAPAADVTTV
jgi:hypothetical protein